MSRNLPAVSSRSIRLTLFSFRFKFLVVVVPRYHVIVWTETMQSSGRDLLPFTGAGVEADQPQPTQWGLPTVVRKRHSAVPSRFYATLVSSVFSLESASFLLWCCTILRLAISDVIRVDINQNRVECICRVCDALFYTASCLFNIRHLPALKINPYC